MKILALDSSGLVASVAIVTEQEMIAEYTINYKKTHSQTLLPMLNRIVQMIELDLETIDAIAIASGPGSFTGLRIGSSTAKGLGLVLKKPIIPVSTIEGLAYNLFGTEKLICPLMDAKRDQVYTGLYKFKGKEFCVLESDKAIAIEEIIKKINQIGEEVILLGDAIPIEENVLATHLTVPYYFAPVHLARQRAGAIGALGMIYYQQGKVESALEHQPKYLRLSQAERERREKEGDN